VHNAVQHAFPQEGTRPSEGVWPNIGHLVLGTARSGHVMYSVSVFFVDVSSPLSDGCASSASCTGGYVPFPDETHRRKRRTSLRPVGALWRPMSPCLGAIGGHRIHVASNPPKVGRNGLSLLTNALGGQPSSLPYGHASHANHGTRTDRKALHFDSVLPARPTGGRGMGGVRRPAPRPERLGCAGT
jgi:hypothetical protein